MSFSIPQIAELLNSYASLKLRDLKLHRFPLDPEKEGEISLLVQVQGSQQALNSALQLSMPFQTLSLCLVFQISLGFPSPIQEEK